jgi:copper chaperone
MISFQVRDMTCGHCVSTIAKALKALDPSAKVEIDLGKQLVHVQPLESSAEELSDAIKEVGYTPVQTQSAPSGDPPHGACCGTCHS